MLNSKATWFVILLVAARPAIALNYVFLGEVCLMCSLLIGAHSFGTFNMLSRGTYLRGRRLRKPLSLFGRKFNSIRDTVKWGDVDLPCEAATTHFLAVGTTGAGKTLLLTRLMRSVLPTIGKSREPGTPFDRRALVYDAKTDLVPTLLELSDCRVVILHPFDERGAAWDMSRDISTPAAALQVATLLLPLERAGSGNPFFILAAQNILRGVVLSFVQTVQSWSLRDVVLVLRCVDRLRQVLEKTSDGRAIIDQYFNTGEAFQGIRATIATKMAPYEVIAAAWDAASDKVSMKEFIEGEFILVLGNDEAMRTAMDAVNRLIFQRVTELILASEETRSRQTWVFLDEVREAGKLDGLSRLMTKGRSKGACVALGFQAIEGMRDVYGQNLADEIVGLTNNKAILRTESPVTAQWASDLFGKTEVLDRRVSFAKSRSRRGFVPSYGRSRTLFEQRLTTDAVLASEIMMIPPTGRSNGLNGYFITRSHGAFRDTIRWGDVQPFQSSGSHRIPTFVPREDSAQYLREWTSEDYQRLRMKPLRLTQHMNSETVERRNLRSIRTK